MKIRRAILVMLLGTGSTLVWAQSWTCHDVERIKLEMSIHASNIANAFSTRTPEGGAYKRKVLRDRDGDGFQIESVEEYKLVYQPGHPDANDDGFVAYPNISQQTEGAAICALGMELRLLAKAGICNSSLIEDRRGFIIKYKDGDIQTDAFTSRPSGELSLWTRRLKGGMQTTDLIPH